MLFFIKCMLKGILLTSFFLVQVSSTRAAEVVSPEMGTGFSEIKSGTAEKFMVVAANPLAAEAGAKILRMGGTAVDAAIAVQLVLNLVAAGRIIVP